MVSAEHRSFGGSHLSPMASAFKTAPATALVKTCVRIKQHTLQSQCETHQPLVVQWTHAALRAVTRGENSPSVEPLT